MGRERGGHGEVGKAMQGWDSLIRLDLLGRDKDGQ